MRIKCKCGHIWNYKGNSKVYATCPDCKTSVKMRDRVIKNVS